MSLLEEQDQLNPQTLSFQDFSAPRQSAQEPAAGGAIGSSMLQPQAMGAGDAQADAGSSGSGGFWTLKYYQPLFDVDTIQVLVRLKNSFLPRPRGAFFELVSPNPDLYGPFWIATTLIFAMAMTGNLASYINWLNKADAAKGEWTYDFNQLTFAGGVVYSYVTLLPVLMWLLLRYYGASKRLVDILCIYGYTLAVFVPISVLCVVPSDLLRWLLVFIGGGISGVFLLSNFHAHLSDCFPYGEGDAKKKTSVILGGMLVFHVALLFLFKLYFFHCTPPPPPRRRPVPTRPAPDLAVRVRARR